MEEYALLKKMVDLTAFANPVTMETTVNIKRRIVLIAVYVTTMLRVFRPWKYALVLMGSMANIAKSQKNPLSVICVRMEERA